MILFIAPRYDAVTERTHAIAERALTNARAKNVEAYSLFVDDATCINITASLELPIEVIAYFGHGDSAGQLLTQDRESWCERCGQCISDKILYAHACRGMLYLSASGDRLGLASAIGYRIDLFQPVISNENFWNRYTEIHGYIPERLVLGRDFSSIRRDFHDLCTRHLLALYEEGAALIELIAVEQARSELAIIHFNRSSSEPLDHVVPME